MNTPKKALIFSAFVCPGSGYFFLKRKWQGGLFLTIIISILLVMMSDIFQRAQIIAEQIVQGNIALDPLLIRELIESTPGYFSMQTLTYFEYAIGVLWLIGLIDCYRIGRKWEEDKN